VLETNKTSINESARLMIGEDYFFKEEKPSGITGELLLNVQNLSVKNDEIGQ
jgi:ABC-type uncharacterized transport system ATPase subunit